MSIWDLFFPVDRTIATAAFLGTVVLLINGKKKNKKEIVTIVLVNYLTSVYLTKLVAEVANLSSLEGVAFAIGVGGFSVIDRVSNRIFQNFNNTSDNGSTQARPD